MDGFDEVGAVVADGADSHAHGQGVLPAVSGEDGGVMIGDDVVG